MSRVFTSESTGAGIHVFSDDHCPPHVHARHRGEDWIARVGFSYLSDAVEPLTIAPSRNAPLRRTLNRLLDDVQAGLPTCRRSWWKTQRTICLNHQWVIVLAPDQVELSPTAVANAKRIVEARYDPGRELLLMTFDDATTLEVRARP
jgi:hypothetical protein